MTHAHEGTAFAGLALAIEFDGVVPEGRPGICATCALATVAADAWADQNVDPRVAYFDGQGLSVGIRSEADGLMRAAIASAPDLISSARTQ
jgi:hypothetical protein